METEFWSPWVEDPEVEDRWLQGPGCRRELAEAYVKMLHEAGRQAFLLPFGKIPECQMCRGFTDEHDQICKDCKDALPAPEPMREVA